MSEKESVERESVAQERYRSALLANMQQLAGGRVNDVVRLAFLDEEGLQNLDELNLAALSEFKRNSNGTVEIKLTNRVEVLEKLMRLLDGGEQSQAEDFFRALEACAHEEKPEEVCEHPISDLLEKTAQGADLVV